ncbi:hypothetical protein PEX1_004550 [Penicillium expansum]|nr:hypothetical protein PEX1_004550 [Penicillium expansum]
MPFSFHNKRKPNSSTKRKSNRAIAHRKAHGGLRGNKNHEELSLERPEDINIF